MVLSEVIYRITKSFPSDERFGLSQQLRRAAVSVPSNIAEGAHRNTNKEFNYFLGIASGSAAEVYTQVELAARLGYVPSTEAANIKQEATEINLMINTFQQRLKRAA